MELSISLGIALAGITLFILWTTLHVARGLDILKRWAAANGYQLLEYKRPFHSGGFNLLTTSSGQIVYRVRVRDGNGEERAAWIRCGTFFGGVLFSDETEVKWIKVPKWV